MPVSSNFPSDRQSFVIALSPSKTWIKTPGWLSAYVLNTWVFFAGIVVPLSIHRHDASCRFYAWRCATIQQQNVLRVASPVAPDKIPACTAAPYATASSGLMRWFSSFPSKKSLSRLWTFGTLVDPPTNTTWSTSAFLRPASFSTLATGFKVRLNRSEHNSSNFAREIWVSTDRCPDVRRPHPQ